MLKRWIPCKVGKKKNSWENIARKCLVHSGQNVSARWSRVTHNVGVLNAETGLGKCIIVHAFTESL